jgi:hypothetical protein
MQRRRSFIEMLKSYPTNLWGPPWFKEILWRRELNDELPPAPPRHDDPREDSNELPWELRNEVD